MYGTPLIYGGKLCLFMVFLYNKLYLKNSNIFNTFRSTYNIDHLETGNYRQCVYDTTICKAQFRMS